MSRAYSVLRTQVNRPGATAIDAEGARLEAGERRRRGHPRTVSAAPRPRAAPPLSPEGSRRGGVSDLCVGGEPSAEASGASTFRSPLTWTRNVAKALMRTRGGGRGKRSCGPPVRDLRSVPSWVPNGACDGRRDRGSRRPQRLLNRYQRPGPPRSARPPPRSREGRQDRPPVCPHPHAIHGLHRRIDRRGTSAQGAHIRWRVRWRNHRELHSEPLGSRGTLTLIGRVLHDPGAWSGIWIAYRLFL
jgi:hypothetical protein